MNIGEHLVEGYLLDASAVLALLNGERGADRVEEVLDHAFIHTVNLIEVLTKLFQKGVPDPHRLLEPLNLNLIEEMVAAQAARCAELHAETRAFGVSLGDCVCLGIADWHGMTAVTTESKWVDAVANQGIKVLCVR